MHITARLEEDVLRQLLDQLLPVTIRLDAQEADRWIRIDRPRVVDFVTGKGLRLEVGGVLSWTVAGAAVQLGIHSAQLLLVPEVEGDGLDARLVFRPSLEKMDLKNVPGFIDSGITVLVRRQLAGEGDKLAWHFGRDLDRRFSLGGDFAEVESFVLGAGRASVQVVADAFVLDLALAMGFSRRDA